MREETATESRSVITGHFHFCLDIALTSGCNRPSGNAIFNRFLAGPGLGTVGNDGNYDR